MSFSNEHLLKLVGRPVVMARDHWRRLRSHGFIERPPEHSARVDFFPERAPPIKRMQLVHIDVTYPDCRIYSNELRDSVRNA